MLTTEQINEIGDFCEKWGVNCYDVKVELVDHLSSTTENLMAEDPALLFDEAFIQARQSFGDMSFEQIVKQKEKAIARNGRKQQLKYLSSFFTLPKILLTIGYVLVCYAMIRFIPKDISKIVAMSILTLSFIPPILSQATFFHRVDYFFYSYIDYKNKRCSQIRPLLLFSKKNNIAWLSQLCVTLLYVMLATGWAGINNDTHNIWVSESILFFVSGLSWIGFGAYRHQKKKLLGYAVDNYPAAFEIKQL